MTSGYALMIGLFCATLLAPDMGRGNEIVASFIGSIIAVDGTCRMTDIACGAATQGVHSQTSGTNQFDEKLNSNITSLKLAFAGSTTEDHIANYILLDEFSYNGQPAADTALLEESYILDPGIYNLSDIPVVYYPLVPAGNWDPRVDCAHSPCSTRYPVFYSLDVLFGHRFHLQACISIANL